MLNESKLDRLKILIILTTDETTYPHLLQVSREVLALGNDGNVVELSLLLGQQLEPAAHRALDDLTGMVGRLTIHYYLITSSIISLISLKGGNSVDVCNIAAPLH